MEAWWEYVERKVGLNIKPADKAHFEALTGCNPILLRPLLNASRITPDSQDRELDEHYAEVIEHLYQELMDSQEVRNVHDDILAFVKKSTAATATEPRMHRA